MKKVVQAKVAEYGRRIWARGAGENQELQEYVRRKREMVKEEYADGSDGARVRVMLRGESLPVRKNSTVRWRWGESSSCTCGEEETEQHVLLECEELASARGDLREWWRERRGDENIIRGMKGFINLEPDIEEGLLERIGKVWREYERRARQRENN